MPGTALTKKLTFARPRVFTRPILKRPASDSREFSGTRNLPKKKPIDELMKSPRMHSAHASKNGKAAPANR